MQTPLQLLDEIIKGEKLDPWQEKILNHEGSTATRCGRQVGKSFVISRRCARLALKYPDTLSMIIAAAQRQSSELFEKTYALLFQVHLKMIEQSGGYKDKPSLGRAANSRERAIYNLEHGIFLETPTKTEMRLKDGQKIYSLPAGKTGAFIRCYTIDFLYGDEAAYIPEPVWLAVTPMLAIPQKTRGLGWTNLLSTPFGKGGYFYNCCHDIDFLQTHKTSEQCTRMSREFLQKEKRRLTKSEYAQEYLGEFIDDWNQFFKTDLIKERMTFMGWNREKEYSVNNSYYMGMDIAKYGEDETAICILEMTPKGKCKIVKCDTRQNSKITETARWAERLNATWHFKHVFVDNQGLGEGVLDLLREALGKSRVSGLNNANKSIDDDRHKKLLKEDLYSNALKMMELKEIEIINHIALLRSLKSMQFEYTKEKNLMIFGSYSHLCEAFVRVCWAKRQKKLKLFIA